MVENIVCVGGGGRGGKGEKCRLPAFSSIRTLFKKKSRFFYFFLTSDQTISFVECVDQDQTA